MTGSNRLRGAAFGAALLAGLAGPAVALGPQIGLKDTPGAKFNNDDIALMKARVDQALNADKEGEVLEWKNEKTGASGSVVAMNHLTWNGLECRRLHHRTGRGLLQSRLSLHHL